MKVVVLGASGFVGFPIATAFARAGHIVCGVTRSKKNGQLLAKEEIVPLVCESGTDEGRKVWGDIAADADVVIDTVPATSPDVPLATYKHVVQATSKRGAGAKITYIYTGGSWTQSRGPGGLNKWTSEQTPHSGQVKLTAWRWEVEKAVLESKDVHGIVIRPSLVIGASGSLSGMVWFGPAREAAKKGEVFSVPAYKDTRYPIIHRDDLADLYVRVAERGPILGGQAFIGSNQASERATDVLDAVVRVTGAKGYKIHDPTNPFEEALASTGLYRPVLGNALTGWSPRKPSFVDGVDLYWTAYLASLEENA